MPEPPTEIFETLALLEAAGDLGAYLGERKGCELFVKIEMCRDAQRPTFHVLVSDSESPRLLKATKDLFPCSEMSARRTDR